MKFINSAIGQDLREAISEIKAIAKHHGIPDSALRPYLRLLARVGITSAKLMRRLESLEVTLASLGDDASDATDTVDAN